MRQNGSDLPSVPRTYVLGVGDDANLPLIRALARNDGIFEWVRSSEPLEFKLNTFLDRIGRRALTNLAPTASPPNFDLVYPLEDAAFAGRWPPGLASITSPIPWPPL